jgi:hypothetical protein
MQYALARTDIQCSLRHSHRFGAVGIAMVYCDTRVGDGCASGSSDCAIAQSPPLRLQLTLQRGFRVRQAYPPWIPTNSSA